ncbi:MAG: hypothetical protein HY070_07555 [Chloroflexi bacterium]|nr:hypothetical protein [Chloroflexota bacterium]
MYAVKIIALMATLVATFGASAIATASPGNNLSGGTIFQEGPSVKRTPGIEKSKTPDPKETETESANENNKNTEAIAKYFGVSLAEVDALRQQGFGLGEIAHLYALAKASGKSVSELAALRKSGEGWGEIAKQLGVSPAQVEDNLGKILRAEKEFEKPQGTPSAPGKSEDHRQDKEKSGKGK